jgi:hypothetical protein
MTAGVPDPRPAHKSMSSWVIADKSALKLPKLSHRGLFEDLRADLIATAVSGVYTLKTVWLNDIEGGVYRNSVVPVVRACCELYFSNYRASLIMGHIVQADCGGYFGDDRGDFNKDDFFH